MPRSKFKLAFIANKKSRKASFMRRKKGLMKKLYEITTLCDIRACAVMYSPDTPVPEMWPSMQGVQEVISKFLEVPEMERNKKMVDHTTYLQAKIAKEEAKLNKLTRENQKSLLRQSMFDCLEGKNTSQLDLQNLSFYTQNYIDQLHARAEFLRTNGESSSSIPPYLRTHGESSSSIPPYLTTNGESSSSIPLYLTANGESSSSSLPPLPAAVASVNPSVVAGTAAITAPVGYFYLIPYQNMNMNINQNQHGMVPHNVLAAVTGANPLVVTDAAAVTHEPGQHYAPAASYDQTQYLNMNQNHHGMVPHNVLAPDTGDNPLVVTDAAAVTHESGQHYQVPMNLVNQMHGMNLNFDLGLNPNLQSHQYPTQQQIFMNPMMGYPQQMGYVGEHASIPFMDGNNYNYHQLPTVDPATNGHMPTITTSATSAFSPYINNNS